MTFQKCEKLGWVSSVIIVVMVFVTLCTYKVHKAYKNGHHNNQVIEIWMPEKAQLISTDEREAMIKRYDINNTDSGLVSINTREDYKRLLVNQPVYVRLSYGFGVRVDCLAEVGEALLHNCYDYSVETGASSITNLAYLGNGKLQVQTKYSGGDMLLSSIWALLVSAFWSIITLVVLWFFLNWLLDMKSASDNRKLSASKNEV
jgi:hypothetical protein